MATYTIVPERRTLHGRFSRDLPPVLTIDSGDTIIYQTLDAGWHTEPRRSTRSLEHSQQFTPRIEGRDDGHALCGPVAIQGAEPGMTLVVHIDELRTGTWGWTGSGGWASPVNTRMNLAEVEGRCHLWTLDPDALVGHNQDGYQVQLRPFMGVMGMPPNEPGAHPTSPPRFCGGNMDCKELVAGSTLYLPIAVSQALFSVGDGHARQGDGEVSTTAIECPMEKVALTFELDETLRLSTPCANTPAGWVTLGFHEDLHEACMIALDAMLSLICQQHSLTRQDALALASVVVDLHVTQLVNAGIRGAHAILPHGAISHLATR
ncbi:MAG TPA: acetamidase/formamidase family protein [Ktedonobacteraceae bacterium]|nr:acetamidase/formamidase family protein [Ktedonobacteraceae bacterium]